MADTNELNINKVFAGHLQAALTADENYPIVFDMKKVNGHVASGTLYVQDAAGDQYKVRVIAEPLTDEE